jgi:hypothetical protein
LKPEKRPIWSTIPACLDRLAKIMKNIGQIMISYLNPGSPIYNAGILTTQAISCLKKSEWGGERARGRECACTCVCVSSNTLQNTHLTCENSCVSVITIKYRSSNAECCDGEKFKLYHPLYLGFSPNKSLNVTDTTEERSISHNKIIYNIRPLL